MTLNDFVQSYLQQPERHTPPQTGQLGQESEWLSVGTLDLPRGRLGLADLQFLPYADDRMTVALEPSTYDLHVRVLEYGADVRISRLRLFRGSSPGVAGAELGETWADTGVVALCDVDRLEEAEPLANEAAAWGEFVEAVMEVELIAGADFEGVEVAVLMSGFGDGSFPVWELMDGGKKTGVEVEFIAQGKPYPF